MNTSKKSIITALEKLISKAEGLDERTRMVINLIDPAPDPDTTEFVVGWKGKTVSGQNVEIFGENNDGNLVGSMGSFSGIWQPNGKLYTGICHGDSGDLVPNNPKTITETWWMVDCPNKFMFESRCDASAAADRIHKDSGFRSKIHECTVTYEVQE